jgi:hypothetical protein
MRLPRVPAHGACLAGVKGAAAIRLRGSGDTASGRRNDGTGHRAHVQREQEQSGRVARSQPDHGVFEILILKPKGPSGQLPRGDRTSPTSDYRVSAI